MANFIPKISYGSGPTIYTFPAPPTYDPLNEGFQANTNETTSNAGNPQTQYNYTQQTFSVSFVFLSSTDKTTIQTFFDSWAKKGKSFTYWPSSDVAGVSYTLRLKDKKLNWGRQVSDGAGDFLYTLTLTFFYNYT